MLLILKKQKFNLFKKTIILKSLVAIFATGLFAVDSNSKFLSSDKDSSLLLKPFPSLNDEQYDEFILGRSFFVIPWVEAPSVTTARDGLGPLFNANTCVSCHPANGRGTLFNENVESRSLVVRLSIDSPSLIKSDLHKSLLEKKVLFQNQITEVNWQ